MLINYIYIYGIKIQCQVTIQDNYNINKMFLYHSIAHLDLCPQLSTYPPTYLSIYPPTCLLPTYDLPKIIIKIT
jgi:hypothetical protein